MDTLSFFRKILPSQGIYVLAVFRDGRKAPAHSTFSTIEAAAAAVTRMVARGQEVFHACASYAEKLEKPSSFDPSKMRDATRVTENAAFVRSVWVDVDVGEKKDYPYLRAAVEAVTRFCINAGIPRPMYVKSGRGLHCYWPLARDLPAEPARVLMESLHGAAQALGFRHDQSRTRDIASILRPVGSLWQKEEPYRLVKLLKDADPISPKDLLRPTLKYRPAPVAAPTNFGSEWDTGIKANYPPSSAERIVQFCNAVRIVADARGDVPEPEWRAMLGLVKHTVEGDAKAHEWSQGHPSYDEDETQRKLDHWSTGPTTCEHFSGLSTACAGCAYKGKVKSPIQLGYSEELPPVAPEPEPVEEPIKAEVEEARQPLLAPDALANKMPQELFFWPKGVAWDGRQLKKSFTDEDGVVTWIAFSTTLFYPFMRYRKEDGTWSVKICALVNPEKGRWRTFEVDSKALSENQAFANAMGAYEIYAIGKLGKELMKAHAIDVVNALMHHDVETQTYNAFGWHDNGFVIGNNKVTKKGLEPVFLGSRVPPSADADFGRKGTTDEWAKLVDKIYNRPGAEPYQFLICAAFGAPLVKLADADMWHGIPIALTGQGGLGKTTTCKVACSIFGDPRHFAISTNEQGSTMNALIQRVALMRNLPIVLDEMTGRSTQDLQGMLYALSNGKPKERSRSDGSLIGADLAWDTISFITGNMNITGMLAQLDKHKAEATQLRCFEIPLPDDFNDTVFRGINAKDLIEGELLAKQYGAVGDEYLKFILAHKESVAKRLQKMRAGYAPSSQDETRERFYYDLIATAMMGGALAAKLGFIKFDLAALKKWAEAHTKTLRASRAAQSYSPEDYFQAFLGDLHGRTVVTQYFKDARIHKNMEPEFVDERMVRDPVARHAVKDRRFLVTVKAFSEWCNENNVNPSWLKDELDKRGYLRHRVGEGQDRMRIFKGTTLVSSISRCIEFDYDKIEGSGRAPHLRSVESPELEEAV